MADALELGRHITGRGDIAVGQMPEIKLDRWLETPFERNFVDAPGRLAARLERVVHGREEVIGRVKMRTVVSTDAHRSVAQYSPSGSWSMRTPM